MKSSGVYWLTCLVLTSLAGLLYWQHRQEQQNHQWQLRQLDATLQTTNARAWEAAESTLRLIADNTARNHNQVRDIHILRTSRQLHRQADSLVQQLEAGRYSRVPGAVVARARRTLRHYTRRVQPLLAGAAERPVGTLADTAAVFERAGNRPWWLGPLTPIEASLLLTQTVHWVRQLEARVIYQQEQQSGNSVDSFLSVQAFAAAESNVVTAGQRYKAVLFLVASARGLNPKMQVNGEPIAVLPDGLGQVEFVVPASAARARPVTAYWDGLIRVRLDGRDTVFRRRVPYIICPKS